MQKIYISIGLISAVVVGLIIYVFTLSGSPFQKQAVTRDQVRLSNFTTISYRIESYFDKNDKLPSKLSDLTNVTELVDPKSKKNYDYSIKTETSYELCAEFETNSSDAQDDYYYRATEHSKGYDCIEYKIPSYLKAIPTPIPPPASTAPATKINLSYDGDVLKWDDDFTKSSYSSVTLSLLDAKGAQLLGYNAKGIKVYRPYFSNWKTAVLKAFIDGYYQNISNEVTNTTYKTCSSPAGGVCYK